MTDANTWDGGYIRTDSNGKRTYYIYKKIGGKLYERSTRCSSEAAAYTHWERFQRDPTGYDPADTGNAVEGLRVDAELTTAFLRWSREEKRNTAKWVRDQQRALVWWLKKLPKKDFRKIKTSELVNLLDAEPAGRKQKIAAIKTFASWLVEVRHLMERREDPTAGLLVPQSKPEQLTQAKAHDQKVIVKTRAKLAGIWRDAADVLSGTGWHFTELERFQQQGGKVAPHPMKRGAKVLDCPQTKGGEPLRVEVSSDVAAAAARILKAEPLNYFHFREALLAASGGAVQPGHFRHSVATWAINAGAAPAEVAAFLNHKSTQTTKRFYATFAVPTKVPTLR